MSLMSWLRNPQSARHQRSRPTHARQAGRRRQPAPYRPRLELLEDRTVPSAGHGTLTLADAAAQAQIGESYGQLPLAFEANQGQTDAEVNFLARGPGYALFLTPDEAVLSLQPGSGAGRISNPSHFTQQGQAGDVLRMQVLGASATAQVLGLDRLPGTSNYLIGTDPTNWHTGIVNYARAEYQNLYPGIDLVYYGNQRQLEYDFVVAPGASAKVITL